MATDNDQYMTLKEAARAIGISRQRLYQLRDAGRLHFFRRAGHIVVPRFEVGHETRRERKAGRPREKREKEEE